ALLLFALPALVIAQVPAVPKVHSNIFRGEAGLEVRADGTVVPERLQSGGLSVQLLLGNPKGSKKGINFNFGLPKLSGRMYYGFIPYGDSKHPQPVFFRKYAEIENGKSSINIADDLKGRFDMVGWAESGQGTLGYRVVDEGGLIIYEGRVSFTGTGPFKVAPTIIEGPWVNQLTHHSAIISFTTNKKVKASLTVGDQTSEEQKASTNHEILLESLSPERAYSYTVQVEDHAETYEFTTAPEPGSRKPFVFAYASDSRSGQGGGERDVFGANFYIMKKIFALASQEDVAFMQFSGDLIDGYLTQPGAIDLQYANWKRAIEPFAHYFPVYISMGNHEALMRSFRSEQDRIQVDRFPYETESAEAVFARNFVNPTNGPKSEDGASYDPDPKRMDFPSYEENVFYSTYDNAAVVVLNSDYWYAPSTGAIPLVGGGLHGYIMDQQLAWFTETLAALEADEYIDHVFITQHTPFFPNGGHVKDDMWYGGNNKFRPYVAGKPLEKGIIERRDQLLEQAVNQSSKVIAILTGDEHNYARTEVGPETNIYPSIFKPGKIELSRTIYQINNGAAGAPYYAQEETPWTPFVSGFTTQNALVFFHIDGKSVNMVVKNPDTLEEIERFQLR
ncbi:MAG: metallophosphoesterase, partial [Bacteroidota bacterium]